MHKQAKVATLDFRGGSDWLAVVSPRRTSPDRKLHRSDLVVRREVTASTLLKHAEDMPTQIAPSDVPKYDDFR